MLLITYSESINTARIAFLQIYIPEKKQLKVFMNVAQRKINTSIERGKCMQAYRNLRESRWIIISLQPWLIRSSDSLGFEGGYGD